MPVQKGTPFHLARAEFRSNGETLGIVSGFSYNRQIMVADVRTNQLHRDDAVITGYSHNISFQAVKAMGSDVVDVNLIPTTAGTHAQQLQAAIDAAGANITVHDAVTGELVYDCQGVTPTSVGENLGQGSVGSVAWSATCDRVLIHGEV